MSVEKIIKKYELKYYCNYHLEIYRDMTISIILKEK